MFITKKNTSIPKLVLNILQLAEVIEAEKWNDGWTNRNEEGKSLVELFPAAAAVALNDDHDDYDYDDDNNVDKILNTADLPRTAWFSWSWRRIGNTAQNVGDAMKFRQILLQIMP